ncbi:MAG TPA: short-chain dehydrogenase, partial [Myxococcota bacterium]
LNRMPRQAQPVPPIYEPEVAAEAIVHVAHHPRRTFLVAPATVTAVWANKLAPAVADAYLARTGYDAQMTNAPVKREQPSNLWHPVEGDRGARGAFADRSRDHSVQAWANRNRALVGGALAGVVAGVVAAALLLRRALRARRG